MHVDFFGQPYQDGADLRDFLERVAADGDVSGIRVGVAWAKRSGLGRIRSLLEELRGRPMGVELIVGISEGGATVQGLELAIELSTRAYVFHDSAGRTFHPKIYLAKGSDTAHLLIGSHNLTKGGLFSNYEAALVCHLDLSMQEDQKLVDDTDAFLDKLVADRNLCKPLDQHLLKTLISDPRYRIGDEDHPTRGSEIGPSDMDDDYDSVTDIVKVDSVFGPSDQPRRSGIPLAGAGGVGTSSPNRPAATGGTGVGSGPAVSGSGSGAPPASTRPAVLKRWHKRMRASDAQYPRLASSNVTGNLRLSQAGHSIDWTTYFRDDFFDCATWRSDPVKSNEEFCLVQFDVRIRAKSYGIVELRVDYLPSRMSGQGNVPTVLKWGALAAEMRKSNHTDDYVVLERLTDDSFRLTVQKASPAAFIK